PVGPAARGIDADTPPLAAAGAGDHRGDPVRLLRGRLPGGRAECARRRRAVLGGRVWPHPVGYRRSLPAARRGLWRAPAGGPVRSEERRGGEELKQGGG